MRHDYRHLIPPFVYSSPLIPTRTANMAAPVAGSEAVDWADDAAADELGPAAAAIPGGSLPPDADAPADGGLDEDHSATVKVLQADPSTPYHSAATFEEIGLKSELLEGIYAMKFNKPSKIQASSLPMILAQDGTRRSLIAQGHNGSGKTACFVLAMLSKVDDTVGKTQALCVVPTRELARQIGDVVATIGKFTKTTTHLAIPLTDAERNAARRARGARRGVSAHVVIGTPGKVTDLLKKRELEPTGVQILVLDEADHMVSEQGMGDQTVRIKKQLPESTQVLLFSATYADEVRRLAEKVAPDANQITIQKETLALDKVSQYYLDAGSSARRFEVINDIYDTLVLGQTVIFVERRRDAQELTSQLREGGHAVSVLTGGEMGNDERDRVIDEFRAGTTRVLVTTNVLSRGVDIPAITAVINYDLPCDPEARNRVEPEVYLHRIGRTGRFGRRGIAINLVYDEQSRDMVEQLAKYYGKAVEKVEDVEELETRLKSLQG